MNVVPWPGVPRPGAWLRYYHTSSRPGSVNCLTKSCLDFITFKLNRTCATVIWKNIKIWEMLNSYCPWKLKSDWPRFQRRFSTHTSVVGRLVFIVFSYLTATKGWWAKHGRQHWKLMRYTTDLYIFVFYSKRAFWSPLKRCKTKICCTSWARSIQHQHQSYSHP